MTTITPQITPTKKQELAWDKWMDDTTRFIVFGGGAGGGKSWVGCEMILTSCYFYPGSSWFLARNELKRLMNTTYKTFKKVCTHHKIPDTDWRLDGQYNIIYFNNGSEVHLLDVAYKPTDDMYERFGSYEFTGGFGDEINEWEFDAYDVLKSRIGRNNVFSIGEKKMISPPADFQDNPSRYPELAMIHPKFFGACNPAKNWVFQEFYKPWKNGTLSYDKAFIQSLYSDNPYTAHTYGEQLASIKNVINRQRLMDGKWEYTDDISSLTTYSALEEMFSNTEARSGIKYAVFDIARGGADNAIANLFDGWHSYRRIKLQKTDDPMELRQEIRDILSAENIAYKNAIYDDNGVGWAMSGGELKGMRQFIGSRSPLPTREQLKIRVRNNLAPEAQNPNFTNLKSQAGFFLADKINNHQTSSLLDDDSEIIIEDLTALLVQDNIEREGKLKLRPKESVKDDLGRSPDYGDTYIMRSWFDLYDSAQKSDPEEGQRISGYYDMLALKAKMKITKQVKPRAGLR